MIGNSSTQLVLFFEVYLPTALLYDFEFEINSITKLQPICCRLRMKMFFKEINCFFLKKKYFKITRGGNVLLQSWKVENVLMVDGWMSFQWVIYFNEKATIRVTCLFLNFSDSSKCFDKISSPTQNDR